MDQSFAVRLQGLHSVVGYTFGRLATDPRFKNWRALRQLEWRTVTRRANELVVSLSAAKGSDRLLRNRTFPALISAQLEMLRETLIGLTQDTDRQSALSALDSLPATVLPEIVDKPGSEGSRKAATKLLETLVETKKLDSLLALFVLVELGRAHWTGQPEDDRNEGQIFREIRFAPEHQQAGIAILSYFSVILKQKLPEIDAAVSITQDGDRVVLSILHADGTEEKIAQTLHTYGLVVKGELAPDQFLENPVQAMALKHKLELTNLELRQTRDLLHLERSQSSQRLSSLEAEVSYLRDRLSEQLDGGIRLGQDLLSALRESIAATPAMDLEKPISLLLESIIKRDEVAVRTQAAELMRESPDVFERLSTFVMSSAFGGSVGNAAYDWLKILWPVLPK